jgi:hypothetical protein
VLSNHELLPGALKAQDSSDKESDASVGGGIAIAWMGLRGVQKA